MSVSKKIRFEVFKRDGFRCAYCGKSPPTVTLEIDHISPKSKKGTDDINNLLTACFDCNRGKRDIPLNVAPHPLSENLEILKEREEQLKEYSKFVSKIEKRIQRDIKEVSDLYVQLYPGWEFSENFKQVSLRHFLECLPKEEVLKAIRIANAKFPTDEDRVIKYFCGVCWRRIRGDYAS